MNKCGIYQIRNLSNNKIYIGQSINIPGRIKNHKALLRDGKHHSLHLQNAYNKYGVESFEFATVLLCEQHELTRYEQALVDRLAPQYNAKLECVNSPKGIKLRESTKQKISMAHKGKTKSLETRERMSLSKKGIPISEEQKQLRLLNPRNSGKPHTDEWKKMMSEKMKGRKKSPEHVREGCAGEFRKTSQAPLKTTQRKCI